MSERHRQYATTSDNYSVLSRLSQLVVELASAPASASSSSACTTATTTTAAAAASTAAFSGAEANAARSTAAATALTTPAAVAVASMPVDALESGDGNDERRKRRRVARSHHADPSDAHA